MGAPRSVCPCSPANEPSPRLPAVVAVRSGVLGDGERPMGRRKGLGHSDFHETSATSARLSHSIQTPSNEKGR